MRIAFKRWVSRLAGPPLFACLLPFVFLHRYRRGNSDRPRLFFGATSIFILPQLAQTLRKKGYIAHCGAVADIGFAVPPGFERVVRYSASSRTIVRYFLGTLEAMAAFVWALGRYDIFHHYMDGGFLRRTPLQLWEVRLLKLAGKKVVLFPYGSDAWALERVPDPDLRAALAADYPWLEQESASIARRLDIFCAQANVVVGCLVHNMVLPRCDRLMLTCYGVETDELVAQPLVGQHGPLRVFHAPNHKHFKGTGILVDAVQQLRNEGVPIELDLAQRLPRQEVLLRMRRAHVVVDQLLCGYGMTALEGMALGRIVISGVNWPETLEPFLSMESFKECPIHWASPKSITDVLRFIEKNREQWSFWAEQSRAFVTKYHSLETTADNWVALHAELGYAAPASARS